MTTTSPTSLSGSSSRPDDPTNFLRAALEWLPIGVLIVNSDGIVGLANRELERVFGYSSVELIGQPLEVLVPDGPRLGHGVLGRADVESPVARPMAAGRELFGRRRDGSEVPVEIGLVPLRFGDLQLVLVSVIDLSERRRIETELRQSRDEQMQFEVLVAELGAEFVSVRSGDVDRAIEEALGRVVRALDLDRSTLFQLEENGDFVHTHQWTRPGWASPPPRVSAKEQFPWQLAQVRAGELVSFATLDEIPDTIDRRNLRRLATKSGVTIPLVMRGRTWGAVTFAALHAPRTWAPDIINRLRVVSLMFANLLARKQGDETLHRTLAENAAVRERLREENAYLRQELKSLTGAPVIVGHSPAIRRVLDQVRQVAGTDTTVLLVGETGSGKGLLAARIHELSGRSEHPMVRINCASLSATSIETELFGSEKGLQAGDEPRHVGRLELAHTSTIFLDEIADLPFETQASLTRALQDKQFRPVGSATAVKVDVRVIAATRHDLTRAIAEGTFRDDLYYRLDVFPIQVPPLREHPEDIPLLVWRFVDEFSAVYGKPVDAIDQESMAALQKYTWPGNARELRNVVERAVIVATNRHLQIPVPSARFRSSKRAVKLRAVEAKQVTAALTGSGGRIHGKAGAAARLGVTPRALKLKMAELGVRAPRR